MRYLIESKSGETTIMVGPDEISQRLRAGWSIIEERYTHSDLCGDAVSVWSQMSRRERKYRVSASGPSGLTLRDIDDADTRWGDGVIEMTDENQIRKLLTRKIESMHPTAIKRVAYDWDLIRPLAAE